MHKIANTNELQSELRRLIAYAGSDLPSRTRIAAELRQLSQRVAADRSGATAVLNTVERKLKSKFPQLHFERNEDEDLGFSLSIEPKNREPESSVCVVSVSEDAESSSVTVHSYGSSSSHSHGPDFNGASATKLTEAAIKLIEKHVA